MWKINIFIKGEFVIVPQNFIINIENQKWLFNEQEDLCSHGEIYLNVDGTIITQTGMDEEWGISESALALLRTLDKEYICDIENEEGAYFARMWHYAHVRMPNFNSLDYKPYR